MKAKKAIQQKMYRENSQGYGEQLFFFGQICCKWLG